MAKKQTVGLPTFSRTIKFEHKLANSFWEKADTPVSLSCHLLLRYGEIDQLVSKKIDPAHYNNALAFSLDYQSVSLLSKSKVQPTSFNRRKTAYDRYILSEDQCRRTNEILLAVRDSSASFRHRSSARILRDAAVIVNRIIGPMNQNAYSRIEEGMSFGPGATVGVRRIVTPGRKFDTATIDGTAEAISFGLHCLPHMWRQRVTGFNPVSASRLEFVPKNAKTDRVIEIQPSLNIYIQKGIGSFIRDRLRSFGVDLSDQTRNQQLALEASRDGLLATVDLRAASDTIAHELVRQLLGYSHPLLLLMEWSRVGKCQMPDKSVRDLEKFSAMGNGFTFELESLIFYAIARACSPSGPVSVYGDDIILPCSSLDLLVDSLEDFGFEANDEKTFGKTYFRESCGADFFKGIAVRPLFLKREMEKTDDFIEACYIYANAIVEKSYNGTFRDRIWLSAWTLCYTEVPTYRRFRVHPDYKSGGFIGSFDECAPSLQRAANGWQGYLFRYSYRPVQTTSRYTTGALTASVAWGSSFSYGEEALRGESNKLPSATKKGYALAWPDFGPWD